MVNIYQYAPIGKSNLIQALGLQEPYKEGKASTCSSCKFYGLLEPSEYGSQHDKCEACAVCRSMTENAGSNYVYEKNIYAINGVVRKKMSSSQEIHLYLLLHFLHSAQYGVTAVVDEKEVADILGVHVRTVQNNLEKLKKMGYITYQMHPDEGKSAVAVRISNYEEMFKPQSRGGRGYVIFSKEMLKKFFNIKNINSLRIQLRMFIDNDKEVLMKGAPEEQLITKTYKEIGRYLPSYCKRNVIKKALSQSSKLLQIETGQNSVTFLIDKKYNAGKRKKEQESEYKQMIEEFLDTFNREVAWDKDSLFKDETKSMTEVRINNVLDGIKTDKPPFPCKDRDVRDFVTLCMEYGYEIVTESILEIYAQYIVTGKEIHSVGALVRTFAENMVGVLPTVA